MSTKVNQVNKSKRILGKGTPYDEEVKSRVSAVAYSTCNLLVNAGQMDDQDKDSEKVNDGLRSSRKLWSTKVNKG